MITSATPGTGHWTLGVDTATDVRVGLARDGEVVGHAEVTDRMQHAEQLVPLVRRVLSAAGLTPYDLDLIVVGLGPGPFTGLRVGIATARMLAAVADVSLWGVCTLDVLARQAHQIVTGPFLVATDARRREVYWARYDATGARTYGPAVDRPADLPELPVVGPATLVHPDLNAVTDGPTRLDAGVLAAMGAALPSAGTEPLYLRRPDATLPGAVKSVLARAERP
ncbi:MAG: tRNA (adenosine(37)-N6)-threonylcarbamoyltransferase complex dimerization subunit type 1 TsaB [Propionibacteriaceae bacterium]